MGVRGRWLKPEFFTDKKIAALGACPALVYQVLWVTADDGGVAMADPEKLYHQMFYGWADFSATVVEQSLLALARIDRIRPYTIGDEPYVHVVRLLKQQGKIHKPSKFRHPRPAGGLRQYSGTPPAPVEESPPPQYLSTSVLQSQNKSNTVAATPPVQDVAAPEKRDASPGKPRSPYAELLPLVRQFLWIPDGTPPADWDDRREGSVLKALLERQPLREIKIAIEGLALLRDAPGMWADAVSWMHPGEKLTCRALYNTRSGVTQTFALAHRAYWKHATYSKTRRTNVTPSDISSDELVPR